MFTVTAMFSCWIVKLSPVNGAQPAYLSGTGSRDVDVDVVAMLEDGASLG